MAGKGNPPARQVQIAQRRWGKLRIFLEVSGGPGHLGVRTLRRKG
jgi:hypothetical protein